MNVFCRLHLLFLVVLLSTASCLRKKTVAPDWVVNVPQPPKEICAVGGSEPTYYRKDGKNAAADSARAELGRTIKVRIESIVIDFQSAKSTTVETAEVSQVSSITSDTVLAESRVEHYWLDSEGQGPDKKKGMTYALACMPFDRTND